MVPAMQVNWTMRENSGRHCEIVRPDSTANRLLRPQALIPVTWSKVSPHFESVPEVA